MNQTVGDIDGNYDRILGAMEQARSEGAQIVAVPELAITGYPPEDLLLKPDVVAANRRALAELAARSGDLCAVIGFVDQKDRLLYNAAAICHSGEIVAVYRKQLLPNYGVFDEHRYFAPGRTHKLFETNLGVVGVCICEDVWFPGGPAEIQGDAGAQVVVNINSSPFHKNKLAERAEMLGQRARKGRTSIAYVNMVGGQDELVFDGASMVVGPDGEVIARWPQFEEHFDVIDVPLGEPRGTRRSDVDRISLQLSDRSRQDRAPKPATPLGGEAEIYSALRLSLRDYVIKNGFEKVVVGLSGGIDSSLTATIAVDSLDASKVLGVAMPSEVSTSHSIDDAKSLAANLGIEMLEMPIAPVYRSYAAVTGATFGEAGFGVAEENLQARIRGNLLMFISNRYGHLVLATGNKSEMACGYATLYGDMAGGFALLKDVFKTEVYALAGYRNSISSVIPDNVMTKQPSAELRPDQKDSDSLPPYDQLDPILESYIEHDRGIDDITGPGFERALVAEVIALVDQAEYKRRQAPPGPKVTTKAFGRDRRLPITNAWTHRGEGPEREPANNTEAAEE